MEKDYDHDYVMVNIEDYLTEIEIDYGSYDIIDKEIIVKEMDEERLYLEKVLGIIEKKRPGLFNLRYYTNIEGFLIICSIKVICELLVFYLNSIYFSTSKYIQYYSTPFIIP